MPNSISSLISNPPVYAPVYAKAIQLLSQIDTDWAQLVHQGQECDRRVGHTGDEARAACGDAR